MLTWPASLPVAYLPPPAPIFRPSRSRRSNSLKAQRTLFATLALISFGVYTVLALVSDSSGTHRQEHIQRVVLWPSVSALAFLYYRGYRQVRNCDTDPGILWITVVASFSFAAACLLMAPFDSLDLYAYVNKGWLQYHYGLNPYVSTVDSLPFWQTDPMFTDVWISNPCPYGFLFARIACLACRIGNGNLVWTILVFKLFNLGAGILTGILLYLTAEKLRLRRPGLVLYLYLWNPLLLLQAIANGHNDILMAAFVIITVDLMIADLWPMAIIALAAGVLIKYVAAVVVPFALIMIVRRKGLVVAAACCATMGLLIAAVGAPYLSDFGSFKLLAAASNFVVSANSLEATIAAGFAAIASSVPALAGWLRIINSATTGIIWFLALASIGLLLVKFAAQRFPDLSTLLTTAVFAEVVIICVGSSKFYPWYVGMFFPMALLLEGHWLRQFVLVFSLGELLHFTPLQREPAATYVFTTGLPVAVLVWRARAAGGGWLDRLPRRRAAVARDSTVRGQPE